MTQKAYPQASGEGVTSPQHGEYTMPTHEAARKLGVTRMRLRYEVATGRLSAVKGTDSRGLLRFNPREIEAEAARRRAS